MPSPKEKPKGAKTKKSTRKAAARSQPAISAKQAAKLLKDKYVQQLDQRQPESGSAETQAVDQVEEVGSWAVDELLAHERPRPSRQPELRIKERPQDAPRGTEPSGTPPAAPEASSPPSHEAAASPRQRSGPTPKEKAVQVKGTHPQRAAVPAEPSAPPTTGPADAPARTMRIKERPAVRLKEQRPRTAAPSIKEKSSSLADPSIPSIKSIQSIPSSKEHPAPPAAGRSTTPAASQPRFGPSSTQPRREIRRQMLEKSRHSVPRQPEGVGPRKAPSAAPSARSTGRNILPRKGTDSKGNAPKIRGAVYRKGVSTPKTARVPIKSAVSRPIRNIRQNTQRRMTQQAVQKAAKAAKTSAVVFKRSVVAVTKAASALVSALAGIVGGGILLMALVVVIVIAAIANSPFGLFFAQEPNAPDTVSVAQAVGTVNMAYNSRLELLQAGDYDTITLDGQAPDWAEVLAVFAVKTAGADVDGLDVATLDPDRVSKLTAVFWDMTGITVSEETVDHPASGTTAAWTEAILHITITPKTADDMRVSYGFSEYQNSALDELLVDRAALTSLAGSLAITSADVREVLDALPDDLDPARRNVVQTALQLVGKVNYFWGGKSYVIGWDPRWGQLAKVWSAGNSTTGTYRPFGLDCSGFIDWALRNAGLHSDGHWYIGTNLTAVSQADALPGDLALYPDASHVGMVVGRNEAGKLLVCHCSSGQNNVVVTEFTASGFTAVGRPSIYST
jgi:cell wall-associated NlpC family hydrolase